jgi:hypothetical protein
MHVFIADLRMRARLDKPCEERFIRLVCLNIEAFWDPLRSDSRFKELVRRIGLPQ